MIMYGNNVFNLNLEKKSKPGFSYQTNRDEKFRSICTTQAMQSVTKQVH